MTRQQTNGISRRQFLGGGVALSLGTLLPQQADAAPDPGYRVVGWTGDEYELPHKARDGWDPGPPKVVGKHDVVVVGAGIAGMTAAYKLRDTDLRVLELASGIGGTAKSSQTKGREFNIGSAYFTGIEGERGELYAEIGLKPVHVGSPADSWLYRGRWIDNPYEDHSIATMPKDLQQAIRGLRDAIRAMLKGKDFPENPWERSSKKALQLDRISFGEWLKPYAHPDLMLFVDSYCLSAMGTLAKDVSAFGGLNFYSEVVEELAYAYPEGNYAIVKALAAGVEKAGKDRIHRGCMVTKVVPLADDRARVCYVQQGKSLALEAKRVVLAVPYFVASRTIEGLAASQRYALNSQRYCSYIVANLVLDKPFGARAYDHWIPSVRAIQDAIPVDRVEQRIGKPRPPEEGQIVSCFCPCRHPIVGRWRMMTQSPAALAKPIVAAFERAYPGSRAHLREVHMTRWGHAFIINRPGMVTRWLPNLRKQIGPIHLAHSDGQALPAVESSTHEAFQAARWVRSRWKRR